MRKINAIKQRNSLWSQMKQIFFFMAEFKNRNKTDRWVCDTIALHTMCIEFFLNAGKLLLSRCQECLDRIQNLGFK